MPIPDFLKWPDLPRCRSATINVFSSSHSKQRSGDTQNVLLSLIHICNYRAFEIIGDSMLPTPSGSVIVGEKVDNLDEVKNNAACIVISRNEGIVYKRVQKNGRLKNKLTLVSDNPSFHPYTVNAEEVLEMWQAQVVISRANTQNRWDMAQLANVVSDLQQQVTSLKKRMN